ncbi:MAG: holo-ACP synthase [Anaerolineales bacterium]|jgi:holo-[acyl-carrier protein] synthase
MNLSSGIDLIEIERIQKALDRHGERFLKRVFTPAEIDISRGSAPELAARFAAKEAASKALGTGIGPISWVEIEVLSKPSGEPFLRLTGRANQISQALGLETWSVSLTHSRGMAAAVVVCIGGPPSG